MISKGRIGEADKPIAAISLCNCTVKVCEEDNLWLLPEIIWIGHLETPPEKNQKLLLNTCYREVQSIWSQRRIELQLSIAAGNLRGFMLYFPFTGRREAVWTIVPQLTPLK